MNMTVTTLFGVVLAAVDGAPRVSVGALGNASRGKEREQVAPGRVASDKPANDGDRPIERVAG